MAHILFLPACGSLCNFAIYCNQGTPTTPEKTTVSEATTPGVTTTTTRRTSTTTETGEHLIT